MTEMNVETELLLLPDGQILAHNLTPVMAGILTSLNPTDETMTARVFNEQPRKETVGKLKGSEEH